MRIKELKNKSKSDLLKLMKEKREALREFRFGISGSKTRNVKENRALKRDIARILTVLNLEK